MRQIKERTCLGTFVVTQISREVYTHEDGRQAVIYMADLTDGGVIGTIRHYGEAKMTAGIQTADMHEQENLRYGGEQLEGWLAAQFSMGGGGSEYV